MLNLLRSRNPVSEETFLERLRGVLKSWRKSGFLKIRSVTALAGGLRYFPLQMPYIRRGVAFVYLAARWIIFDEKLRRWQVDEHSGRACTPFCSFRRFHVSSRVFSSGNCQKKKRKKKKTGQTWRSTIAEVNDDATRRDASVLFRSDLGRSGLVFSRETVARNFTERRRLFNPPSMERFEWLIASTLLVI